MPSLLFCINSSTKYPKIIQWDKQEARIKDGTQDFGLLLVNDIIR